MDFQLPTNEDRRVLIEKKIEECDRKIAVLLEALEDTLNAFDRRNSYFFDGVIMLRREIKEKNELTKLLIQVIEGK